jgi:thiol-disulfide isomerase/thioredoxin
MHASLIMTKSLPRIILAASILTLAPQVFAQAPGAQIEFNHPETGEAELLGRLEKLRAEGKLFALDQVKAQLKAPVGGEVDLPKANTEALKTREVAKRARAGYVQVGYYYLCKNCDRWHINIAGGYAIAKDAIATCHHCVEPNETIRDGFLIAIDSTGEILPITGIIACNKSMDVAILRVQGGKFTPLPLSDQVDQGDAAYCFSKPLGQENYFSNGIVNRFFWRRFKQGEPGSIQELENLRMNVSTDWAPGSSGSAVVDASANVIGHVSTIMTLNKGGNRSTAPRRPSIPKPNEKAEAGKAAEAPAPQPQAERNPTLITIHEATPARCVMALAREASKPKTPAPAPASAPSASINNFPGIPCAEEKVAEAPAITLHVGDPAPKLAGKFIQGEPVTEFAKDKVYMVEFWATWCGPCKANIPHLNELQKKYADKGLIVIGQSIREPEQSKVEPFVKEMGEKMSYRVAIDSVPGDGKDFNAGAMVKTWMDASGSKGIPAAFMVGKDGKIAWFGHPATLSEDTIEKVLAGTFDVAAEKAKADAAKQAEIAFDKLRPVLAQAIKEQKWEEASKYVDQWEKLAPSKPVVYRARFEVALGLKTPEAVNGAVEKLTALRPGPRLAIELISKVANSDIAGLDWAPTEKLLRQCTGYAKGNDLAQLLDITARVIFRSGRHEEAVKVQEQALASTDDERIKRGLSTALESYKAGKLPAAAMTR